MIIQVVYILLIVTTFISLSAFSNQRFTDKYSYSPYDIKHRHEYVRIVAHMFIHADWIHLMFNMFTLYFLGDLLERQFMFHWGPLAGSTHFLILYFFGGIFATILPYKRNHENPHYRALGASGAVSAVVFAAIVWNPTMQLSLLFIPIPIPAYLFGPLYLIAEYYADKRGNTGIAHDAHIGGAIFGIIYVLFINIDKGKELMNLIFHF